MRVLFDIELYGDAKADYHLLEALLLIKRAIIIHLESYAKQIKSDKGFIIVQVLPKIESTRITYESSKDSIFAKKFNKILKNIDYFKAVDGIGDNSLN